MEKKKKITAVETLNVQKELLKMVPDEMDRIKALTVILNSELRVGMDDAVEKKDQHRQAGLKASARAAEYMITKTAADLEKQIGIKV